MMTTGRNVGNHLFEGLNGPGMTKGPQLMLGPFR
jgi:hypothetical protein